MALVLTHSGPTVRPNCTLGGGGGGGVGAESGLCLEHPLDHVLCHFAAILDEIKYPDTDE